MGGYGGYEIKGYKNLGQLEQKAHSIAYRITLDEAMDMPPVMNQYIEFDLNPEAQKIYNQMANDFLVEFSDKESCAAPIILTKLLRLQQITGGFLPVDEIKGATRQIDTSKLETLKELMEDFPAKKKIVIFSRFIPEIKAIENLMDQIGRKYVTLTGEIGDPRKRGQLEDQFQNNPDVTVFIAQIQTGGLSITLTASNTVIYYSANFSYTDFDQSRARVRRIGQKSSTVNYIFLVANGTVDQDIIEVLKNKGDMAKEILDKVRQKSLKISLINPFTNSKKGDILNNGSQNS